MIVFHRPEQSVEIRSLSPSAGKPARLMADWRERFPSLDVRSFEPLDAHEFERVHDPDYVCGVMSLRAVNGFRTRSAEVCESLRYTTGSMVAATCSPRWPRWTAAPGAF